MLKSLKNKKGFVENDSFSVGHSDIIIYGDNECTFESSNSATSSTLALIQNDILNELASESWNELMCN